MAYTLQDYQNQDIHGDMDFTNGIFTSADGKEWMSLGSIDFGNNNFYEVMVLKNRPTEFDEPFRPHQFPVYLCGHEEAMETLGIPLPEFFADLYNHEEAHHFPTVVAQLGVLLDNYINPKQS